MLSTANSPQARPCFAVRYRKKTGKKSRIITCCAGSKDEVISIMPKELDGFIWHGIIGEW